MGRFKLGLAAAAVTLVLQSPAMAASMLEAPASAACAQGACVQDYRFTQVFNPAAGHIGAVSLDRSLLGEFRNTMFRLTFWTNGGTTQVGDFGSFDLSVLGADIVTLAADGFDYDGAQGDLIMRLDFVRPAARGAGGGGGALAPLAPGPETSAFTPDVSDPIILTPPDLDEIVPPRLPPGADLVITVPEPSTWALAIAGFGMAGAMLRRRGVRPAV